MTLATDATREKLLDALRQFTDEAEKADWAMIYYAGHGMEVNGINYLVPVEARSRPTATFSAKRCRWTR